MVVPPHCAPDRWSHPRRCHCQNPEDLWRYLAAFDKQTGSEVLAIPHNGNLSNGRMFSVEAFDGKPLTKELATMRARTEFAPAPTQSVCGTHAVSGSTARDQVGAEMQRANRGKIARFSSGDTGVCMAQWPLAAVEVMASCPLTIERAYRQRSSPSREQAQKLLRLMGARRFVANWALKRAEEHYGATRQHLCWVALSREFTELKREPDTAWLAELPREPFNQTLRDLNAAWQRYFKQLARKPRRKKYGTVKSVRFTLDQRRAQVDREGGTVQLDGVGRIRFKVTRPLEGRLRSVTVSVDAAGRWFVSFTADGIPTPIPKIAKHPSVGVDRGLKEVAVTSRGERFAVVKELKRVRAARRRHQRSYGRGRDARLRALGLDPRQPIPKGTRLEPSKRMRRRQQRIGRLTARLNDLRREALHQASRALVNGAQVICLEDLAVRGLARGGHRGTRRAVHAASMGELARQIAYKAAWAGREVVKVDRFFPSSQLCSTPHCDYRHTGLMRKERQWCCPRCGVRHDRDVNAARNIEREGLRLRAASAPRSGVRDVRGGYACAPGGYPPVGQPNPRKRELTPHAGSRRGRSTASVGSETAERRA